jgi:8-oxo-dGTP pyrophosphatase MutT (NUDIX family)
LPEFHEITGFARHVRACNNAVLPGDRLEFRISGQPVGWADPRIAGAAATDPAIRMSAGCIDLPDPAALPALARALAGQGLYRLRHEEFDVRESPEAPALARIDRGAIPFFGVRAIGVHLNGLVRRPDGLHLWIARRALDKRLDAGKLDNIVAGGVPAGLTPQETLVKEAAEEAAIPAGLIAKARPMSEIRYAMLREEGLRRDVLYCYDLDLPASFTPSATDGEVEGFELWPIARVLDTVRDTDAFKFNVNLVLIDLLRRLGLIDAPPA